MGKKSRMKRDRLKTGEIIHATDAFGLVPEGMYRVVDCEDGFVNLSVGNIYLGVPQGALIVLGRGILEPISWREHENRFHLNNPHAESCLHCKALREEAMQ